MRHNATKLIGSAFLATVMVCTLSPTAFAQRGPIGHTNQDSVDPPSPPGDEGQSSDPLWFEILEDLSLDPFGNITKPRPEPIAIGPAIPVDPIIEILLGDEKAPLPLDPSLVLQIPQRFPVAGGGSSDEVDVFGPGLFESPSADLSPGNVTQSIPAPGALSLLTLGTLSLIGRRRRRTRA